MSVRRKQQEGLGFRDLGFRVLGFRSFAVGFGGGVPGWWCKVQGQSCTRRLMGRCTADSGCLS